MKMTKTNDNEKVEFTRFYPYIDLYYIYLQFSSQLHRDKIL